MTTVSAGRSTRSRRRVHLAVGTGADRLLSHGLDPLVPHGPRDIEFRNAVRASRPRAHRRRRLTRCLHELM